MVLGRDDPCKASSSEVVESKQTSHRSRSWPCCLETLCKHLGPRPSCFRHPISSNLADQNPGLGVLEMLTMSGIRMSPRVCDHPPYIGAGWDSPIGE